MMKLVSLATAILSIVQAVLNWLARKDQIDAGRAVEINRMLSKVLTEIEYARTVKTKYRNLSTAQRLLLSKRYERSVSE